MVVALVVVVDRSSGGGVVAVVGVAVVAVSNVVAVVFISEFLQSHHTKMQDTFHAGSENVPINRSGRM